MNIKSEYQDFLSASDISVSDHIQSKIINDAQTYISPSTKDILFKYSLLFFSSVFISLLVCPQMGVGFRDDYPFFHHFFHANPVLCAIYCAFVFFISTHLLIYFSFNFFEKRLLNLKLKSFPILMFSLSLMAFMILKDPSITTNFILTWAVSIILFYSLFYLIEKRRFHQLQQPSLD